MGQCLCFEKEDNSKVKVALKLPHGIEGMEYDEKSKSFMQCNIQTWLSNLYKNSTWTNWIAYNDQNHLKKVKKGHCKGIVAWNATHISWLCHSVPNFPLEFTGSTISEIEKSELLYGQSFHYYECMFTSELLQSIFHQLHIMDICPIIEKYNELWKSEKVTTYTINKLELSDKMVHIAKSPSFKVDIYSEYLVKNYPAQWKVESWIRGSKITMQCSLLNDIDLIFFKDFQYKESQDHSKWAVSDKEWYWVGDLNRMTSQYHRGGGGFVGTDKDISHAFRLLIKETK
jgi:deoxyribonuclease-2